MKVFLSWSGERSKHIAESLSSWLEQVLQAVEPWVSTDIEKGKRWDSSISKKLEESKVGIICLTSDNLESNWIHFEAGAISKTPDAYVCTFLFDITPANVKEPLSLFQATKNSKEDVLKLLKTINARLETVGSKSLKESNLQSVFDTFWPQLEEKLMMVPEYKAKGKGIRSDRELLEESLQILRSLKQPTNEQFLTNEYTSNNSTNEKIQNVINDYLHEQNLSLKDLMNNENLSLLRTYLIKRGVHIPPPRIRNYLQQFLNESNKIE